MDFEQHGTFKEANQPNYKANKPTDNQRETTDCVDSALKALRDVLIYSFRGQQHFTTSSNRRIKALSVIIIQIVKHYR